MHYIEGQSRDQLVLFPESLDEYVQSNNPVRFLDRFVEALDLEGLGFRRAVLNPTGRPPYGPGDLLKLYIYGYLYQVRSSRQLERQTHCNVEVMWLLERLQPDFKTIADFRRDNGPAIRSVVKEFRGLCHRLELYGRELVAIDGSYFKASNSRDRHRSVQGLEREQAKIDAQIAEYFAAMDQADQEDTSAPISAAALAEKMKRLEEIQSQLAELRAAGVEQRGLTDPDARLLKKGTKTVVGYNVQVAVDSKHHLIAAHEVTAAGNDQGQLEPMGRRAQAALGVRAIEVVADAGYHTRADLKDSMEAGITPYVPAGNSSASKAQGRFSKADFQYDSSTDAYGCPGGQRLHFVGTGRDKTGHLLRYYRARGCADCACRTRCLKPGVAARRISRWEHEHLVEETAARVAARPGIMKVRKALVEHPFGTLKRWMGTEHFLTRGFAQVRTEMSLQVLAYNLKRAINLLGVCALIAALDPVPG